MESAKEKLNQCLKPENQLFHVHKPLHRIAVECKDKFTSEEADALLGSSDYKYIPSKNNSFVEFFVMGSPNRERVGLIFSNNPRSLLKQIKMTITGEAL